MDNNILAVIVTYNGSNKIIKTVDALIGKVKHIYIVDNASNENTKRILKTYRQNSNISISFLDENKGIGHALNMGIKFAQVNNYEWILTMDQDSCIAENMIETYCNAIDKNKNLVCLSANVTYPNTTHSIPGTKSKSYTNKMNFAITSGNLVKVKIYEKVGIYNEALFIDCVDIDFSLRVRIAGYTINRIIDAILYHELGENCKVPEIFSWCYTMHSPIRRYYMYRNYIYIARNYFLKFPFFIIKMTIINIFCIIPILLYDENPISSLKHIKQGIIESFNKKYNQKIIY